MPHWEDVQTRAKKLIEEGLMLLRTGANEAEHIANTTASAARLHMTLKRNRYDVYRALHDLGEMVHTAARNGGKTVAITPSMATLITRISELEEAAERAEKELSTFTVVNQEKEQKRTAKKAAKKRSTTSKSTKSSSKK